MQPDGEQRDEASIYTALASACGVDLFSSRATQRVLGLLQGLQRIRHPMSQPGLPQNFILDQILRRSGNGTLRKLLRTPNGRAKAQVPAGSFLGKRPTTADGLVHLAPTQFLAAARALDERFEQLRGDTERGVMRLISKRAHNTHNSWTQNIEALTNGAHNKSNFVYLNPADAARLGLAEGDAADIHSAVATIRLPVKLLPELMPGTLSVPHGWGHQHASGLAVASRLAGANVNILASDGPQNVEPLSGMAHLSGLPVEVKAASGPLDESSWSGC